MSEPASPCTNVCRLNDAKVCVGCGRHIDEVIEWPGATASRKQQIVAAARARLARIKSPEDTPR